MSNSAAKKIYTLSFTAELEARQLFQRWAEALRRRNASQLTELYTDNAVLIPTLWAEPQRTPHAVDTYFTMLSAREGLDVRVNQSHFEMMDEMSAIYSGIYTFHFEEDGRHRALPARFTFVYRHTPSGWKIVHHHSSQLPLNANG